jgi:hypothetical protein
MTTKGQKLLVKILRLSGSCCACGSVVGLVWPGVVGAGAAGLGAPNANGINLYTQTTMKMSAISSPAPALIPAIDRPADIAPARTPNAAE